MRNKLYVVLQLRRRTTKTIIVNAETMSKQNERSIKDNDATMIISFLKGAGSIIN